jgi:hypothetical protein
VAEAEHYTEITDSSTHAWDTATTLSGYEGESYLHALRDTDAFYPTEAITDSPRIECGEHGFLGWTDGLIHFAEIVIHSTIEGDCAKLTAR